jgi:NADPH:quinone reductase-like Zn-dependent oxidoreductase
VIDYQIFVPIHEHLAKIFGAQRFDTVVDCVGSEQLFLHCAGFLRSAMPYVSVGPSVPRYTISNMIYSIGQMMRNFLLPPLLGGVDRPYLQVTAIANQKDLKRLAQMVIDRKLRVPLDSSWELKDALKVLFFTPSKDTQ